MLDLISAPQASGRSGRAFFDVRVFNPFAPTNLKHQLEGCYYIHEMEKRRQYDEHIREVEHGSLHPWSLPHLEGWANKQMLYICLLTCQEEGPALQLCNGMDQMPSWILAPSILYHLLERHKVCCRLCTQPNLSRQP